jgi:hypothetical protein
MRKFYYLIIAAWIVVSGCEQEADIPLPKVEQKITVSCYISDDTDTVRAYLRWSDPVFSNGVNEGEMIEDAQVVLSGSGISRDFSFNANAQYYELPVQGFELIPGESYSLIIRTPDGTQASAETTIPYFQSDIRSASFERITEVNENNQYLDLQYVTYRFETVLGNLDSEEPYYRIIHYQKWDDPFVAATWYQSSNVWHAFDSGDDEESIMSESSFYGDDSTNVFHKAIVIHCSEDYYRFHKTMENISYGPFAEPTIVYSNVNNGLGIFAGFRQLEILY